MIEVGKFIFNNASWLIPLTGVLVFLIATKTINKVFNLIGSVFKIIGKVLTTKQGLIALIVVVIVLGGLFLLIWLLMKNVGVV